MVCCVTVCGGSGIGYNNVSFARRRPHLLNITLDRRRRHCNLGRVAAPMTMTGGGDIEGRALKTKTEMHRERERKREDREQRQRDRERQNETERDREQKRETK